MKNSYLTTALVTITAAFLFSGCATIFKGSSADIRVNSSPSGATVYINNIDRGQTPQTLSLKRNQNHLITFKMDGYEDVNIEVNKKFDILTTVVGNIFSWQLLGIIVDVATGSAYTLEPADLQANMNELRAAGYLPDESELERDDIHAVMITQKQWAEITSK